MSITWIVVANARHARIFSHCGPNKGLKLMSESVLDADATTMPESIGRASPRTKQPGRSAAQDFAHQVADRLCNERTRGSFTRAILVAPPTFMGLLNAELDPRTAALVTGRLDKDYTHSETQTLEGHLEKCLCV
jgi:protein required for attachment to host cells